jgi:drug/metabolite transporter (DMT)-like permease
MWIIMSVGSAISLSGMLLLFKYIQNTGVTEVPLLLVLFFMSGGMYGAHAYVAKIPMDLNIRVVGWIFLASIFSYLANYLSVTAMVDAPNPGYVTAITAGATVIVAVSSVWLFGSELGIKEVAGIILVLLGLVILVI